MRLAYSIAAAIGLLYGCSNYTDGLSDLPASAEPANTQPIPEGQAAIVSGNTAFAVDFYQTLRVTHEDQNLFVSPASISTGFGLLYAGAGGETAEEISEVFHFDDLSPDDFHPAMGGVLSGLDVDIETAKLAINNAVWIDETLTLKDEYLATTKTYYGATDNRVDFASMPDAARKKINAWVEEKTEDRIKGLLAKPDVTSEVRNVLVNTIYMKAQWHEQFEEGATEGGDFRTLDGLTKQVPLMRLKDTFQYWQNSRLQLLQLPYHGNMSMVVMLPKQRGDLPALEEAMTADVLTGWLGELSAAENTYVDLKLPKFKMETRHVLNEALQGLGMEQAFSGAADFSGITSAPLRVGSVIHQTFLEVDEKGTEAAAATAIVNVLVSASSYTVPPKKFYADHPFLFLIKDDRTGMVLFMGRILEPEQ